VVFSVFISSWLWIAYIVPTAMIRHTMLLLLLAPPLPLHGGCTGSSEAAAGDPLAPTAEEVRKAGVGMTLPLLKGGEVALERMRGAPVVITLFTTWCLRCQAEAPLFNQLFAAHARQGLRMLGIAVDVRTKVTLIRTYVEFVKFRFDVALAQPDDLELVGGLGRTRRVPRTVLLDRHGAIVLDHVGQTDFPALRRRVVQLLRAGAPQSRPASVPSDG
jgi:thiol-disulfide isomerase/thioredoxin